MHEGHVLVIAEKRDAAKRIAQALGGRYVERRIGSVPYYETTWMGKRMYVAPARGHLYGLDSDVKDRSLFPVLDVEWVPLSEVKKEDRDISAHVNAMRVLGEGASDIIIACDYDIEGETIGYNIVKYLGLIRGEVKRAKFSTLTTQELRESFASLLVRKEWRMAMAGRARHFVDYIWGISLSRMVSSMAAQVKRATLSIGRVQGPTLVELMNRESEIRSFVPEPYWQVKALIEVNGQEVEMEGPRLYTAEDAEKAKAIKGKEGVVTEFKEQEVSLQPPPPFNLSDLQREAYRIYGIQPWSALRVLEGLYLRALISYPRTSSQKLPPSINYRRIISGLSSMYQREAGMLTRDKPVEGSEDDPAHPAIYPTGEVAKLFGEEYKLYDLVARRFLATFSKDAEVTRRALKVNVEGLDFSANGQNVIERGWLEIYRFRSIEERPVPSAKEGDVALVKDVSVDLSYTRPPARYTPSTILDWMEKNELGTKATRADIIETLYKRGYIADRNIKVTGLGMAVARFFANSRVITLNMTRTLERDLEGIEVGNVSPEKVLMESVKVLMQEVGEGGSRDELLSLYSAYLKEPVKVRGLSIGKCPVCGKGELIVRRSMAGKRYLKCNSCGASAPLPSKGRLVSAKAICPHCGWPMVRRGGWVFCPNLNCPGKKAGVLSAGK